MSDDLREQTKLSSPIRNIPPPHGHSTTAAVTDSSEKEESLTQLRELLKTEKEQKVSQLLEAY